MFRQVADVEMSGMDYETPGCDHRTLEVSLRVRLCLSAFRRLKVN